MQSGTYLVTWTFSGQAPSGTMGTVVLSAGLVHYIGGVTPMNVNPYPQDFTQTLFATVFVPGFQNGLAKINEGFTGSVMIKLVAGDTIQVQATSLGANVSSNVFIRDATITITQIAPF